MSVPAEAAIEPPRPRRLEVTRGTMLVEGHVLAEVALAGYHLGAPIGSAPIVIIVGGITASPFPFGDAATEAPAWWPALLAEDLVDPARCSILTFCWPGNGSTWKGFDDPEVAYPPLSALGLADLLAAWLEGIGAGATPVTYLGASLGGLVGIAFASRHPKQCARLITISAGLRPDGWGTATRHLQRELVRDGQRSGDVAIGMIRARQLGMLTYRGRDELDTRFGALVPELDRPPVAAYLDHHGQRFAERFPVRTFLMLSEAIDRSRFGGDAASMREALSQVAAEVLVVGVPGDLLFPYALQYELYRELQAVGAHVSLWKLDSEFGHDAFLADQDRLAALLRQAGIFAQLRPTRLRFEGIGARPVREIRIGLIGCGVVGGGVLELLERQERAMAERYGVRFRVTRLSVRDPDKVRPARAAGIQRVARPLDLVGDPEVDVIVEVAGGQQVEATLVAALAAGKPVVTANKALLARKLGELGAIAQRSETPLLCEAAAAAAIPIIRHLSHRADEVDALMAIVNGTCNYVITRLEQDELTLDRAIAEAQAKGFAEADPSADIGGHDAAAKLSILAYRAFGCWMPPDQLSVRGIGELWPADCDLAEAMGFKIRLIAHAARLDGGITAAVEPLLLPDWHLLASVEEEYNAVYLKCSSSGDLSLFGKGAGALPTATAVLGDLIELAQDNSVQWPEPRPLEVKASAPRRHYLRVSGDPHPGLSRRVDSLVRRAGLAVQNRAARTELDVVHHGFVISPSDDRALVSLVAQIRELGRVEQTLWLGVAE